MYYLSIFLLEGLIGPGYPTNMADHELIIFNFFNCSDTYGHMVSFLSCYIMGCAILSNFKSQNLVFLRQYKNDGF